MRGRLALLLLAPVVLGATRAHGQSVPESSAAAPPGASELSTPAQAEVAPAGMSNVTTSAAERARRLGMSGLSAYGHGRFNDALPLFQEAEMVAHSPVFQLYIARCHLALGQGDMARTLLLRIAEQEQPEDPPAWRRARYQANLELAQLAPDPADNEEQQGTATEVGKSVRTAVATAIPRLTPQQAEPGPDTQHAGLPPTQKGAIAAFSVATVALALTLITGGMAIAEASAVKQGCNGTSCREEDLPRAAQAERLANIASAGAVSTLTGLGLGTALLLWPEPSAQDKGETASPTPRRAAGSIAQTTPHQAAPAISLGLRALGLGVALHGSF